MLIIQKLILGAVAIMDFNWVLQILAKISTSVKSDMTFVEMVGAKTLKVDLRANVLKDTNCLLMA